MNETCQAVARRVALKDVAANRRRGGDIRVVLGPKTAGATSGFLGVLTLAPGEYVSEHYHPYSEEFLYVTSGSMTVTVDGEPVEVAAEEGVLVPVKARHRVVNNSDAPATAVFHLSPLAPEPRLGHVDTEELPHPDAPHPEIDAPHPEIAAR
ncbi:cupin domain-containing protein [Streptomyces sp. MST-110588]|uniref:cupin domain-containing protein n=1 Tax=Streptomyces sp. MST-110588 TaxID=2833628 RepID=UPI001F5CBFC4|nr:cupin domain-containing protein [Streptomyces sp. MST-110588]UNO40781.1 cupin domain-containing protein [Streptomyces sp. MST-110588]